MTDALAAKSGSRGEIHDWYCQGLTGCSARIRSTDDADSSPPVPALVTSASQSRPGPARQRHPGRGGQLAGQRDHRGPGQLTDPPRPPGAGQISQPIQAAAGREPAPPLRTVSTLIRRSAAIRALSRPRAAASTICARSRSRCAVFAPWTRLFKAVRSRALSTTGTAPSSGMAARVRSQRRNRLPGTDPDRPGHDRAA